MGYTYTIYLHTGPSIWFVSLSYAPAAIDST